MKYDQTITLQTYFCSTGFVHGCEEKRFHSFIKVLRNVEYIYGVMSIPELSSREKKRVILNTLNVFDKNRPPQPRSLASLNIAQTTKRLQELSLTGPLVNLFTRLKTHFSAYMRRVAFIITSNKHTLSLPLTSKHSLI